MPINSLPSDRTTRSNYRPLFLAALVLIVIVSATIYFFVHRSQVDVYQAVFLSNGQVYFGKITHRGWKTIDVQDVYYLQVKNPPATTASSDDLSLIKLGNELHGPEDWMEINWDQILFIESLRSDSRVVSAIQNYHRR